MSQKERNEIDTRYQWNLTDLYPTLDDWRNDLTSLNLESKKFLSFKGKLGASATNLLDYFTFNSDFSKRLARVAIYVSLLSDEDLRNADNNALYKEVEQLYVDLSQLTDFVSSELAAIEKETFDKYLSEEPKLEPFRMAITKVIRQKEHTLSEKEESLMAKTNIMGDVPNSAYSIFTNAEMPWPTITLSDGKEIVLNQAAFSQVRASSNKDDRELAFNEFWGTWKKFEGTFGELMNGNIKQTLFYSIARKHNSSLEASLYSNNIPVDVYHSLIENVNKHLDTFHRYLKLKQRLMGLDQLKYSDLYAPAVKDVELKYSYEEAQSLVLEAVQPLGKEYVDVIKRAFNERWIDVYPNIGKSSGAYSNGGAYDVHPYILMNYNDQYNSVGTLIHELGHTMHSYLSNKKQPYVTSRYAIFVAEVASTFNEALLDHIMLKKITNKEQRISLLMNMLDGFKGTLFRQTQFAEFELAMHEAGQKGVPLTGKAFSKMYGDIVRKYYGHDKDVCYVDEKVNMEWAFIPHFYRPFYVYQYSTSFVASQALAEIVLSGDQKATERYLEFLSSGGSDFPINILKKAGVDMTTSEPFEKAIEKMNKLMDEIESLL